jgi:hypothetical protein
MRNAMVTYRSIMRMDKNTIPRETMERRGDKNVLYKNIIKKLGGKRGVSLSEHERTMRMNLCMSRNVNTDAAKIAWKIKVKKMQAVEYTNWINLMQQEAVSDTNRRNQLNIAKYVGGKGAGTAYLMNLGDRPAAIRSITHTNSTLQRGLKVALRRLKSGLISGMQVLKYMFDYSWGKHTFEDRLDRIICSCGLGLQDVRHLITECSLVRDIVNKAGDKLVAAAMKISKSCGARMLSMTVKQRIVTVLHMTWAGRDKDKQRLLVQNCTTTLKDMLMEMEMILETTADTGAPA